MFLLLDKEVSGKRNIKSPLTNQDNFAEFAQDERVIKYTFNVLFSSSMAAFEFVFEKFKPFYTKVCETKSSKH